MLKLSFGLQFEDLYSHAGLQKLHNEFLKTAPVDDLLERAKAVEDFVAELFNIRAEVAALKAKHDALAPIYAAKKLFVQRQMSKYIARHCGLDPQSQEMLKEVQHDEVLLSKKILEALDEQNESFLIALAHFLQANAAKFPVLMRLPKKLDFEHLVTHHTPHITRHNFNLTDDGGSLEYALDQANYCIYCHPRGKDSCSKGIWDAPTPALPPNGGGRSYPIHLVEYAKTLRKNLTDAEKFLWQLLRGKQLGAKFRRQQPMGKYIVDFVCLEKKLIIELDGSQHAENERDKIRDSFMAAEGFKTLRFWNNQVLNEIEPVLEKIFSELSLPPLGGGVGGGCKPKLSPTNTALNGCPLDEKISEMNLLKAEGFSIAALAVVTLDNPMCAATGHRICNDCMKSCIYQKQEPVNIPQVETRNLRDVLELPWGFEIYSLLTRWNPLREICAENPTPQAPSGKKVLVVGMGPAGFTLAHYLLNEGHEVLAIDGLKIEPLAIPFEPIEDAKTIWQDLDKRQPQGFGGVTEYGITVRWDKNFLTIIRVLLERRSNFALKGGVRFGSNITFEQAYEMGFDHVAMCAGAGKPNLVPMKNGLARGVRTASDFLMSLQSGGAFLENSIANLQLRAPILVIGGGLTAIDTATEAQTYYRVQCHKFRKRWEQFGERLNLTEEEKIIAQELLSYSTTQPLNHSTILYRRSLQDSPAYRLNHEEVEKAFEEGIGFVGNATPLEVLLDEFGAAKGLRVNVDGVEQIMPARTILIAAGTQPNTVLAQEDSRFGLDADGKYFQMLDTNGALAKPTGHCKPQVAHVLMHKDAQGRTMSFFGDLHPDFAGNVVKAMASAKRGYSVISQLLRNEVLALSL